MNRMMRPAAHAVFAGGDMNLLQHSVLEVPSGGFSWVVEKGVVCKWLDLLWLIGLSFLTIVLTTVLVSLTSARRLLRG